MDAAGEKAGRPDRGDEGGQLSSAESRARWDAEWTAIRRRLQALAPLVAQLVPDPGLNHSYREFVQVREYELAVDLVAYSLTPETRPDDVVRLATGLLAEAERIPLAPDTVARLEKLASAS